VSLDTRSISIHPSLVGAAERLAARSGVLHSSAETTFAGFGTLTSIPLSPLSEHRSPSAAQELLASIARHDEQPVRCHLALPFDPEVPGSCVLPSLQVTAGPDHALLTAIGPSDQLGGLLDAAVQQLERVEGADRRPVMVASLREVPTAEDYAAMVAKALGAIEAHTVSKVVLARSIELRAERALDPAAVSERMAEREPACVRYAVALEGHGRLVGASPELLLSIAGSLARSHPLAGTLPIDAADDDPASLLRSSKDLDEHRLMVEELASSMGALLVDLEVPEGPSVVTLRSVAHLGTLLIGRLPHGPGSVEPLELLAAMLPTPAVGGVPQGPSLSLIAELEGARGDYFAGCLGWFDQAGDAEFVLAIRGAALRDTQSIIRAGAGIVADSDPRSEAAETRSKLASVIETVAPASSSMLSRP